MIVDFKDLTPRERYTWIVSSVVPRPVAWVSTISPDGILNLAPFSYFNGVSSDPAVVSICIGRRKGEPKDTLRNIEAVKELVVNITPGEIDAKMVQSSGDYPPEVSEFEKTGLTPVPSDVVKPPRVKECPISMECRLHQLVPVGTTTMVLAEILRVHADDAILTDGLPDADKFQPIARLGGEFYASLARKHRIPRPTV